MSCRFSGPANDRELLTQFSSFPPRAASAGGVERSLVRNIHQHFLAVKSLKVMLGHAQI